MSAMDDSAYEDIAGAIERRIQAARANAAQVEELHAQIDWILAKTRNLRSWHFIQRSRNAARVQRLLDQAGALQSENDCLIMRNAVDLGALRGFRA